MSLMVAPELVAAAAADLTGIGQAISAANAAAAGPTTQVLAAAGDEVSAWVSAGRFRASLYPRAGVPGVERPGGDVS